MHAGSQGPGGRDWLGLVFANWTFPLLSMILFGDLAMASQAHARHHYLVACCSYPPPLLLISPLRPDIGPPGSDKAVVVCGYRLEGEKK